MSRQVADAALESLQQQIILKQHKHNQACSRYWRSQTSGCKAQMQHHGKMAG
jgi:hypothetical protein